MTHDVPDDVWDTITGGVTEEQWVKRVFPTACAEVDKDDGETVLVRVYGNLLGVGRTARIAWRDAWDCMLRFPTERVCLEAMAAAVIIRSNAGMEAVTKKATSEMFTILQPTGFKVDTEDGRTYELSLAEMCLAVDALSFLRYAAPIISDDFGSTCYFCGANDPSGVEEVQHPDTCIWKRAQASK